MIVNLKTINNSEIVSFDIFDTLLIRIVNKPEDVFFLVGDNCKYITNSSPEKFVKERIKAAQIASMHAKNGECTLREIYDCLQGYSEYEKERLQEEELKLERAVLRKNEKITKLYSTCISLDKRIIAVSDMYLPSSFLMDILKENGFEKIEKVYVSCELQKNKQSGEIFRAVQKELGDYRFLHIGDSWKSDFINPRKNGWESIHINKNKTRRMPMSDLLRLKLIETYSGDYFDRLGYCVLGPILFEFNKWLHKEVMEKNISSILFFSRDGKIIKESFDLMFPDYSISKNYFYISRRAMNTIALWMHPGFTVLKDYIETTYSFSFRSFLKRIGINSLDRSDDIGIDLDKEYLASEFWNNPIVATVYNEKIKKIAVENSERQYDYFWKYFQSHVKKGNLAIVDIGWRGSMQTRLESLDSLLRATGIKEVHGFYLGIESEEINRHGFLYKGKKQSSNKTVIDGGVGVFESLFLAREGTTVGYSNENGNVHPILDEYEINDEETKRNLNKIQQGALDYVSEMCAFQIARESSDEKRRSFDQFKRICLKPCKEDIKKIGSVQFNDTTNITLIQNNGLLYYLRHFKRLRVDYHNAPWKIGFLKANISSIINWGLLYKILKNKKG